MAERLMSRVIWMSKKINALERKVKDLTAQLEGKAPNPHSKVKKQPKFGNQDLVFDGNDGIWKTYAVYKDDEEV